jgi:hypothetical protein
VPGALDAARNTEPDRVRVTGSAPRIHRRRCRTSRGAPFDAAPTVIVTDLA